MSISPKKQDQLLRRSVKTLAAETAREWVDESEVLMRYMRLHPDYIRKQGRKRRIANRTRDLFARQRNGSPPKIRQKYRREVSMAILGLNNNGELERGYIDMEGRLRRRPTGFLKDMAKVCRVNPELPAKEPTPRDRFEDLAERIMALPGAVTSGGQDGRKVTLVSGRQQNGDGNWHGFNFMVEHQPVWEHDAWAELQAITVWDQVSSRQPDQPDRTLTNHNTVTADMVDQGPAMTITSRLAQLEETVASIKPPPTVY